MRIKIYRDNWVETDDLSLDDLIGLKKKIEDNKLSLEYQVNMANSERYNNGTYLSPERFSAMKFALSHKKREINYLQDLISARRKQERKNERTLSDFIVEIIKERTTKEEFLEMVEEAKRNKLLADTLIEKANDRKWE